VQPLVAGWRRGDERCQLRNVVGMWH
jgi:hypothetical protein